ncbi:hypothetical protein EDB84DRAFT_1437182 [Lactarius hengduanensis]|nr:hypothetical protein EDB84DRAFT_1437182 [Lactarius hengduanensis]
MCDGIVHPMQMVYHQLLAVTSSRTTERTSAGAGLTALMRSWVRCLLLSRLTPASVSEVENGLCASASRHNLNHVISEGIGIRSLGKTSRTTAQVDVDEGHVNVKSGAAAEDDRPNRYPILRDAPALSGLSHQLPKRKNKILIKKKSRRVSKRPQCQDHLQLHPHEAIEQFQSNPSREFPKIASTATNHTHRKFEGGMERCPGAQSTAMAPRELDEVSEPRVPPELRGDSTPFNHNGLPEAGTASE